MYICINKGRLSPQFCYRGIQHSARFHFNSIVLYFTFYCLPIKTLYGAGKPRAFLKARLKSTTKVFPLSVSMH